MTIKKDIICSGRKYLISLSRGGVDMPILKSRLLALTAMLLMLFALYGCSRPVATVKFVETYQLRSGTIIDIYNQNGSVTITGWDQDKVEISVYKESHRGQEALDQVDVIIDIADKMVIQTVHPAEEVHVIVNYEIRVPEDIAVGVIECSNGNINLAAVMGNTQISTSNGSITVNNVNGIVSALSSNGNIAVSGVKSLGNLRTSNGNIEAELPVMHEDLEIKTSNGSISLALSTALAADLEAKTSNGKISISNLNIVTAELEQTFLIGSMNEGGYKITIRTSNGSINLSALR